MNLQIISDKLENLLFLLETQANTIQSTIDRDTQSSKQLGQILTDCYANSKSTDYHSLSHRLGQVLDKHNSARETQAKLASDLKDSIDALRQLILYLGEKME